MSLFIGLSLNFLYELVYFFDRYTGTYQVPTPRHLAKTGFTILRLLRSARRRCINYSGQLPQSVNCFLAWLRSIMKNTILISALLLAQSFAITPRRRALKRVDVPKASKLKKELASTKKQKRVPAVTEDVGFAHRYFSTRIDDSRFFFRALAVRGGGEGKPLITPEKVLSYGGAALLASRRGNYGRRLYGGYCCRGQVADVLVMFLDCNSRDDSRRTHGRRPAGPLHRVARNDALPHVANVQRRRRSLPQRPRTARGTA